MRLFPLFSMIFPTIAIAAQPVATSAPPWDEVRHQCAEWAEEHSCQNQADCPSWEWVASCTAQNYYQDKKVTFTPAQFSACVSRIEADRLRQHAAAAFGDPVAETMGCIGGTQRPQLPSPMHHAP